jgi:hypothetical protein
VRQDIIGSNPVRSGLLGGSPEIHEKISSKSGGGVVVAFASAPGRYRYITKGRVAASHVMVPDGQVDVDAKGRARIIWDFSGPGAKLVFFGTGGLEER